MKMARWILLNVLLITTQLSLFGQETVRESFFNSESDSALYVAHKKQIPYYANGSYDSVKNELALDIIRAQKMNDINRIFLAKLNYATWLRKFNHSIEGLDKNNELGIILKKIEYKPFRVAYFLEIGLFYVQNQNPAEALKYLKLGEEELFETRDIALKLNLYDILIRLYYDLKDYDHALEYSLLSLEGVRTLDKTKYENKLISIFNTIGLIHYNLKQFELASRSYDSSYFYAKKYGNDFWMGLSMGNKSQLLSRVGKYEEANKYLLEDLKQSVKIKEFSSAFNSLVSISENHLMLDELDSAKFWLDSARVVEKLGNIGLSGQLIRDKVYSDYLFRSGQTKEAYVVYKSFSDTRDSLRRASQNLKVQKAENSFLLETKKKEIEYLENIRQAQNEELKSKNTVFVISLFAIVITVTLLIALLILFRKIKKDNVILTQVKGEVEVQNDQLLTQAQIVEEQYRTINEINQNLEKEVQVRTNDLQQANSELDTFLYRASHDFRSPIATILGLNSLIKVYSKHTELDAISAHIYNAANNMDRMLHKLQDIYDMNKPLLGKKVVNLNAVVANACRAHNAMAEHRKVQVEFDIDRSLEVLTYPELLPIIIGNIFENAIEYQKDQEHGRKVRIFSEISEGHISLHISDSGIGIDSSIEHQIFKPFFRGTEKSGGNGLGLYLAKKAADKLGGSINYFTEMDRGTEFIIKLV